MGGGLQGEISSTIALVETVEIYSAALEDFFIIPVIGDPIRRMNHTASYRITDDGTVLDLIGGIGDVQYSPEPLLGTRNDLRSFLLRNDTLYALSSAIGPFVEAVSGHTQTPMQFLSPGQEGAYFVTGFTGNQPPEPASFVVDFGSPFGITVAGAPIMRNPRVFHSAVRLDHGIIGLFGGLDPLVNEPVGTSEVYFREINDYFVLSTDPSNSFFIRKRHTATIVSANRILVIGGFTENGTAFDHTLIFSYTI